METTSAKYANGLRLLADWVEAHPGIDLPSNEWSVYSLNSKEEAAKCLLALKPCNKEYREDMFYISRFFGPIKLRYVFSRNSVCTRKVVGTKVVPERIEPAKEEEIIPEHEVEVYEWECNESLIESKEKKE